MLCILCRSRHRKKTFLFLCNFPPPPNKSFITLSTERGRLKARVGCLDPMPFGGIRRREIVTFLSRPRKVDPLDISVIRFDKILPLLWTFNSPCHLIWACFCVWKHFEPTLAYFLRYWAIFFVVKCQKMNNSCSIRSHCSSKILDTKLWEQNEEKNDVLWNLARRLSVENDQQIGRPWVDHINKLLRKCFSMGHSRPLFLDFRQFNIVDSEYWI